MLGYYKEQPLPADLHHFRRIQANRGVVDKQIQHSLAQAGLQFRRTALQQRYSDPGMVFIERRQQQGQHRLPPSIGNADTQLSGGAVIDIIQFHLQLPADLSDLPAGLLEPFASQC